MLTLVMIPALCCDEGLYEGVIATLSDLVSPQIIIPYEATLKDCADKLLNEVEGDFIVMGTSFGGHVAREVALSASTRVKACGSSGQGRVRSPISRPGSSAAPSCAMGVRRRSISSSTR
jgi:hypothetical protein